MADDDLWSYYFQNEDVLHACRMEMLPDEQGSLYQEWLGLHDGMKILDVGCGTGEFTYYLGRQISEGEFTGLDFDTGMIRAAENRKAPDLRNRYSFLQGDAFHLPFEEETFDRTVSFTFLTAVKDVTGAAAEMARVTKRGGLVAAVIGDSFEEKTGSSGFWPKAVLPRVNEMAELQVKAEKMYHALLPTEGRWTEPSTIPYLFSKAPLQNVRVRAVGNFFSLSDGALSGELRKEYIDSFYRGLSIKLSRFRAIPASRNYLTDQEFDRLLSLQNWIHDYLVCILDDNRIWNWNSHTLLLMTGIKQSDKP